MIRQKADSKNGETVKEGYAVQPDRRSAAWRHKKGMLTGKFCQFRILP